MLNEVNQGLIDKNIELTNYIVSLAQEDQKALKNDRKENKNELKKIQDSDGNQSNECNENIRKQSKVCVMM